MDVKIAEKKDKSSIWSIPSEETMYIAGLGDIADENGMIKYVLNFNKSEVREESIEDYVMSGIVWESFLLGMFKAEGFAACYWFDRLCHKTDVLYSMFEGVFF